MYAVPYVWDVAGRTPQTYLLGGVIQNLVDFVVDSEDDFFTDQDPEPC